MKIDRLILILSSIKAENIEEISNYNIKIKELEKELKELEENLKLLEKKENKLNNLKKIKRSMLKTIKIFSIIVELPALLAFLILMIFLSESFSISLVFASLSSILSLDIVYNYYKKILPVSDSNMGVIKQYMTVLKHLSSHVDVIEENILQVNDEIKTCTESITAIEEEKLLLVSMCDNLREENDFVEGNKNGLHKIMDKYHLENIDNTLEIVKFAEGKRRRLI